MSKKLICGHIRGDGSICAAPIREVLFSQSPSLYDHAEGKGWLHFAVPSERYEKEELPGVIRLHERVHLPELYPEEQRA